MHQEAAFRASKQDFYFSKSTSFGASYPGRTNQPTAYNQDYDYADCVQRYGASKEFTPSGKWEMNVSANPFELREPSTQGYRGAN